MRCAVQVERTAELDRLRGTQNRLHGQNQFVDTVLVRYGAVVVEIVRRLANELMVQTGTSAPIKLFILADCLLLNEVIFGLVASQLQVPGVATTGRRINRRVLVVTRSGDRIRLLLAVKRVGPVVRMSCVHHTGLEVIRGRVLGDDDLVNRVTTESVVGRSGGVVRLAVEGYHIFVAEAEVLLDLY